MKTLEQIVELTKIIPLCRDKADRDYIKENINKVMDTLPSENEFQELRDRIQKIESKLSFQITNK